MIDSSKPVLVTGGNGFIGSYVVKKLLNRGIPVRCTLRDSSDTRRLRGLKYGKALTDIRNFDSLKQAAADCSGIIHCASLSNWKDLNSPELDSIILNGTQNLIDTAIHHSIRMVYISSAAALGACADASELRNETASFNLDPTKYRYAYLKSEAEKRCLDAVEKEGAKIVIVNPAETYGPLDYDRVTASTLEDFLSGPLALVCDGGTSIVHVDDVAATIVAAFEMGMSGQKYVAGGENVSIRQIAEIVQYYSGKEIPILSISNNLLRQLSAIMEKMPFESLKANATKYRYATHYWYMENEKTTKDLGVVFRSAKETIVETLDWLKKSKPYG